MKKITIGIDIDGTLIDKDDLPNVPIFHAVRFFGRFTKNCDVYIYSGRPVEQQKKLVERFGIQKSIKGYHQKGDGWKPDIHLDDQHSCELGDKTIIVKLK